MTVEIIDKIVHVKKDIYKFINPCVILEVSKKTD